MRLYGNIFAGETILDMMFHNKSIIGAVGLSVLAYFYEMRGERTLIEFLTTSTITPV